MIKRGSGEFESTCTTSTGHEFDVLVKWRGYSDPGNASGPPEYCYPPEGEVEFEVIGLPPGEVPADGEEERIEQECWDELEDMN